MRCACAILVLSLLLAATRGAVRSDAASIVGEPSVSLHLSMQSVPSDVNVAKVAPAATVAFSGALGDETYPAHIPAVIGSKIYVARASGIYSFDVHSGAIARVSTATVEGEVYRDGDVLIEDVPMRDRPFYAGIDAATGRLVWRRPGWLIGVGRGTVAAKTASATLDPTEGGLEFVEARSGRVRARDAGAGCAPRAPVTFATSHAIVGWAYACAVSANEPYLAAYRLRDARLNAVLNELTGIAGQRGTSIYLTGDSVHYGTYGPGRIGIYDDHLGRLTFNRLIAPDTPAVSGGAADAYTSPESYAFGNDAAWVSVDRTHESTTPLAHRPVYRYSLVDARARPRRLDPADGDWLHLADGEVTFVLRRHHLVSVAVADHGDAKGYPFAGAVAEANGLALLDDRLFLSEIGGDVDVFRRSTQRLVRRVAAHCGRLETVIDVEGSVVAVCRTGGDVDGMRKLVRF